MGATELGNGDVDWNQWPVQDYLAENFATLHPADAAIIEHHSAFYRRFAADSVAASAEVGAGPNLYPLMLAASVSRCVHAYEPGAANVAYLKGQLDRGPDASWEPFYEACRRHQPALPPRLDQALARVKVINAGLDAASTGTYEIASMNFVAEGVTESYAEFAAFCRSFVGTVRLGGHLLAAFMENMSSYRIGTGPTWPAVPVDQPKVLAVFEPVADVLTFTRIDADLTLPEYGYTGMMLITARRFAPATAFSRT